MADKTTLVGRTIECVRPMAEQELRHMYWPSHPRDGAPPVIELDDGTVLFPSMDPEGNGPGALFGTTETGDEFIIMPKEP